MLYFIKNQDLTEKWETDTYWAPNETGYVTTIVDAGIYTEEDRERISNRCSEWKAFFVPATRELINEAILQTNKNRDEILKAVELEHKRHKDAILVFQEEYAYNDKRYEKIYQLAEMISKEANDKNNSNISEMEVFL